MHLKTIAIVGPNGNVGRELVKQLLRNNQFTISAVIRPSSTYQAPIDSEVQVISADFGDQSSLTAAFRGQDAVVCCVPGGATKLEQQKLLIDAAIAAGVKLFFASEFISDILSPHFKMFPTPFVGEKIRVRQYLEEKAATGEIAWTALNAGPFFDMWLMLGHAGFDIEKRKAKIYGSGNCLACWTPVPVAVAAVIRMLENPDPIKNRAIFISGVKDLTQNKIQLALEAYTGDKFEVEHIDLKPIKEKALEDLANGNYAMATRGLALNSNFNEQDSYANFWDKVENDLVGVTPVTVLEAVKTTIATWERR